ncbi:type II toxin-antitoxin system death-on-curing family toxin [Roseovarius mucosus]|uniref:type II toxin-antitoxin system death-on-curing family toxin n=1 Tax=Roseovarius mucosus TaxID=215743 RepID=UPI001C603A97|nr:type II toxin-antitoxin system death-on-curing family toxin [Roseovarius mucosus]MBW4974518.1 type II toxin-antitoxin system death-on-curing family toxin [Roseovarius mucosus]|tara:strand:- start:1100 stop:1480 length:381 start_codon:yes stop_codon:yes gene_type:complete
MSFLLLSVEQVETLHDLVLNPGELPGKALDKSLSGALARVDNRLAYGMIEDVFDLAAAYAEAIAQGHCFNDANKRTAYRVMIVCLRLNGVTMTHDTEDVGQRIIRLAQRLDDAGEMADWLRAQAGA